MERSREAVEEFKRTGKTTTYEKQYIRKDGSRWWGLFSATRLTENLGVEFILDISDRKQTEHDLQASETRFRTVADNVPQVIWTNDAQGDAVYFNRRFLDYTGLSYEELRGPGWMKVVHPDDAAASIERWQVALAAGEVFDTEYRLRSKQGDYRWFIGRNVPLRENGNVINWFGSATDIDDLKRAEARLRESEQRYQLLVEGTPDYAMFLLDENNVITYWSAGAEKVFGWSAEEAVGQTGAMIFTPEDRKKGEAEKELAIALQDGRAPDRRWHLRKDGSRLWVDGVMRRVDRQTGELRGFAKIGRDATDLHNAEEKLLEAHSQLERRVRDRTRELQAMNETLEAEMAERKKLEHEILQVTERERARISQDLHDSLCQELTATAFLLKSQAKSVGKESSHAATALGEAAETVNANAGLARDLARGLHPFELGSGGLVNALRELATRTNERVSCKCECPRSLRVPSHDIALNLYRVAQEAVLNAVKHAKASEIVICIERAGDEIVMSVKDNGTGGVSSKRSSGMGIHMMQYRANASGGTLTIESKRGRGSKVTCRVPAKH
jgi:PAS domain S-box-containing protein